MIYVRKIQGFVSGLHLCGIALPESNPAVVAAWDENQRIITNLIQMYLNRYGKAIVEETIGLQPEDQERLKKALEQERLAIRGSENCLREFFNPFVTGSGRILIFRSEIPFRRYRHRTSRVLCSQPRFVCLSFSCLLHPSAGGSFT